MTIRIALSAVLSYIVPQREANLLRDAVLYLSLCCAAQWATSIYPPKLSLIIAAAKRLSQTNRRRDRSFALLGQRRAALPVNLLCLLTPQVGRYCYVRWASPLLSTP